MIDRSRIYTSRLGNWVDDHMQNKRRIIGSDDQVSVFGSRGENNGESVLDPFELL
jgi:hypothetical protein